MTGRPDTVEGDDGAGAYGAGLAPEDCETGVPEGEDCDAGVPAGDGGWSLPAAEPEYPPGGGRPAGEGILWA
jgi:hypothetical protein